APSGVQPLPCSLTDTSKQSLGASAVAASMRASRGSFAQRSALSALSMIVCTVAGAEGRAVDRTTTTAATRTSASATARRNASMTQPSATRESRSAPTRSWIERAPVLVASLGASSVVARCGIAFDRLVLDQSGLAAQPPAGEVLENAVELRKLREHQE